MIETRVARGFKGRTCRTGHDETWQHPIEQDRPELDKTIQSNLVISTGLKKIEYDKV